jgi:hypothetical protein
MAHPIGPIDEGMMGFAEDCDMRSAYPPEALALALIESDPEIAQALTAAALAYVAGDHFREFCEKLEMPQEAQKYTQMMLASLALVSGDNARTLHNTMNEVNHV